MTLETLLREDYQKLIVSHEIYTHLDDKGIVIVEIHGFEGGTKVVKGRIEGDTLVQQDG